MTVTDKNPHFIYWKNEFKIEWMNFESKLKNDTSF